MARRLGVLLLALVTAGCGSPAASPSIPAVVGTPGPADPEVMVRVTLGIYSGRPDPSWILTAGEAAALDRALGALPRVVGQPPEGGLGYHGFTIERPDGTLIAYRGALAPPGQGRRAYLSDPALTVERLLLESARPHVAGHVLADLQRSLAAP